MCIYFTYLSWYRKTLTLSASSLYRRLADFNCYRFKEYFTDKVFGIYAKKPYTKCMFLQADFTSYKPHTLMNLLLYTRQLVDGYKPHWIMWALCVSGLLGTLMGYVTINSVTVTFLFDFSTEVNFVADAVSINKNSLHKGPMLI